MSDPEAAESDVEEEEEEGDPDDESQDDIVEYPTDDDDDDDDDGEQDDVRNLAQFLQFMAEHYQAAMVVHGENNEETSSSTSASSEDPLSDVFEWDDLITLNPDTEQVLFDHVLSNKLLHGARCEVCDQEEDDDDSDDDDEEEEEEEGVVYRRKTKKTTTASEQQQHLKRCQKCHVVFCHTCSIANVDWYKSDTNGKVMCAACIYTTVLQDKMPTYQTPQCLLCSQPGGWLREAVAHPVPHKQASIQKHSVQEMEKTLFAQELWCHPLCVFWHPKLELDKKAEQVDISNVVLTHGKGLISGTSHCSLCGGKGGLKIKCAESDCLDCGDNNKKQQRRLQFHVTCAREAGLEVDFDEETYGPAHAFYVKCYRHGGSSCNLQSKIDDLLAIGKKASWGNKKDANGMVLPLNFAQATRLLNAAIRVMKTLGWAWRWAEWWVQYGCKEEEDNGLATPKKQVAKKRKTDAACTREKRCQVARRCRLAAIGAALRSRAYDNVVEESDDGDGRGNGGFDQEALDRALRALVNETILVGSRTKVEKDFLVEWLARAYRSKSRLLGFGNDKIQVVAENSCLHHADNSPKFELGKRPVPGKQVLRKGQISEALNKAEVDDFMLTEEMNDNLKAASMKLQNKPASTTRKRKR